MVKPVEAASQIAMDVGQTGIRVRWVLGDESDELALPGVLTDRDLMPQLAAAVESMVRQGRRAASVAAGVSGMTDDANPASLAELVAPLGVTRTVLAHDSVTSYLGALGDRRGVVVAAGTGVVTLAVGETKMARVDGWGYLIGDAGAGYWIGRAGLDAAMRGYDGRGPKTILTELARDEFPDLEAMYVELQADEYKVSRIARYSRIVDRVADTDAVAGEILQRAAAELAHSAASGLKKVGEGEAGTPLVCAIGNVFNSGRIKAAFLSRLRQLWGDLELTEPAGSGLDGAARLVRVPKSSALSARILRA